MILSVSERTVRSWLSRTDKDRKARRNQRIFDLWLACWTNKEIAADVDLTEEAVRLQTQEMADLPKLGKSDKASADHATDFDPPIYNIWKQQTKTARHSATSASSTCGWPAGHSRRLPRQLNVTRIL